MAIKTNSELYACKECGIEYSEKIFADECEKFCKANHACSLELIREHAVLKILQRIK